MPGPSKPKTGGRTRGTPNKLTAKVKDAIQAAFDEVGGKDYLVQIARDEPRVFCTLLGKLLPAQVRAEVESEETMLIVRNYTGIEWEEKAREQALLHPTEDRPPRLN